MIDLGDVHRLTHTHTDPAGVNLVNAGTMTLTITRPDSTVVTVPSVSPTSVGRYEYDYLTTQTGRHVARWAGTGTNPGAKVDVFDVRPADPGYVISLADAKAALNQTGSEHDEELRSMVEATTVEIEAVVGPVVVRSYSEVHDGGPLLVLRQTPVVTLTTLVPLYTGGATYLPADMDLDPLTGIVRRLDGAWIYGPLRVTYAAGRSPVPANITEAAKIILSHKWETQRGHTGGRPGLGEDTLPTPGLGFLIPRRAMEALAPHRRAPVLA